MSEQPTDDPPRLLAVLIPVPLAGVTAALEKYARAHHADWQGAPTLLAEARAELLAEVKRYGARRALGVLLLHGCTMKDIPGDPLAPVGAFGRGPLGRCVHYGGKRRCRKAERERLEQEVGDDSA